jgi:hypothetical protein
MKRLFYIFVFVGSVAMSSAQTSDAETEAMLNLLGVQKREAIAKLVFISSKDSTGFWRVYDEYLTKNKEVAKSRLKLYENTARAYGDMKPALADSLARLYFQNRMNQEKSLEEYYNKMKGTTNAVVAFQFYQAEVYLLTMMRASIMQQIPTYGEMAASSKKR